MDVSENYVEWKKLNQKKKKGKKQKHSVASIRKNI